MEALAPVVLVLAPAAQMLARMRGRILYRWTACGGLNVAGCSRC
jgi:hypothetical protein